MTSAGQRRQYDSTGRQAQARATRVRVLQAATSLFLEQGYAATPVTQIARAAGVSAPTVFAGFRSKVNLLKEAIDVALAGDDEPIPLARRPVFQRLDTASTLDELIPLMAEAFREIATRASPIILVAYAAADSDAEIAALSAALDGQRLTGARMLALRLATAAGRADDKALVDRLRDEIWTLNSPQVFQLLTIRRGWSPNAYRGWLHTALRAACGLGPP